MPKRRRQTKKKLAEKERLRDAKKWLMNHPQKNVISAYSKRYDIHISVAKQELMQLGYYDDLCIQYYEHEILNGNIG